jgi:hypothetical protein
MDVTMAAQQHECAEHHKTVLEMIEIFTTI